VVGGRARITNIIYYSVVTRQRCSRLGRRQRRRRRRRRRRQAGERARTYTRPLAIRHWWRARRGRRNIIGSGGGGGFSRFRASKARPGGGGVCGGAACGDRRWGRRGRARLEYIPTTPDPWPLDYPPRMAIPSRAPASAHHRLSHAGSWPRRRGVARRCVCGDSPCAPLATAIDLSKDLPRVCRPARRRFKTGRVAVGVAESSSVGDEFSEAEKEINKLKCTISVCALHLHTIHVWPYNIKGRYLYRTRVARHTSVFRGAGRPWSISRRRITVTR